MQTLEGFEQKAAEYLRQGISPRRLAVTLALGFAVGCIPIVGVPTVLCAVIALAFGLNQPAIQAANYVAMPFQVGLIVPLVRLGGKLFPIGTRKDLNLAILAHSPAQALLHAPQLATQIGDMAAQALCAWLLLAIPAVVLLTPMLTAGLRRLPYLAGQSTAGLRPLATPAAAESCD